MKLYYAHGESADYYRGRATAFRAADLMVLAAANDLLSILAENQGDYPGLVLVSTKTDEIKCYPQFKNADGEMEWSIDNLAVKIGDSNLAAMNLREETMMLPARVDINGDECHIVIRRFDPWFDELDGRKYCERYKCL